MDLLPTRPSKAVDLAHNPAHSANKTLTLTLCNVHNVIQRPSLTQATLMQQDAGQLAQPISSSTTIPTSANSALNQLSSQMVLATPALVVAVAATTQLLSRKYSVRHAKTHPKLWIHLPRFVEIAALKDSPTQLPVAVNSAPQGQATTPLSRHVIHAPQDALHVLTTLESRSVLPVTLPIPYLTAHSSNAESNAMLLSNSIGISLSVGCVLQTICTTTLKTCASNAQMDALLAQANQQTLSIAQNALATTYWTSVTSCADSPALVTSTTTSRQHSV